MLFSLCVYAQIKELVCFVCLFLTHPLSSRLFRSLLCLLCKVWRPKRQRQEDLTGPRRQIRTGAPWTGGVNISRKIVTLSRCHVAVGCWHNAPKRPRAWISIDILEISWSLEQEHLERKIRANKSNWWDVKLCFVKPSCRHQAPPHACAATYETELEHQI